MIKSVYNNQEALLNAISQLYIGKGFHLDPTYSKGHIHKGLKDPELKSDIAPAGDYDKADCTKLSYGSGAIRSIMFDPPFLAGGGKTGIMHNRFSSYKTVKHLFSFYNDALKEFYRVLEPKGYLIFKCQDLCNGRVQTFSHCEIFEAARSIGFYARDLFILIAKNRAIQHNVKEQIHARKFHCYFWVFQKCKKWNKSITDCNKR